MSESSSCAIVVGGGVVGMSSAHYLGKAGFRVTVIDRDTAAVENCTDGCAGMVVPSHFVPLASPGIVGQALKWMLRRDGPFHLAFRADPELWRWCGEFLGATRSPQLGERRELLRDMALESRRLYVELADQGDFGLAMCGLLNLCRTEAGLEEEAAYAAAARELGIEAEVCSRQRLAELDPTVTMKAVGGVWFPADCHLDPLALRGALQRNIQSQGGRFVKGEVASLWCDGGSPLRGVVLRDGTRIEGGVIVVAAGLWSTDLLRPLGLRLPMEGGKGYSLDLAQPRQQPELCSLLKEDRVAVTPINGRLRVAGTMDICGLSRRIDARRVRGLIESFCRFFPAFEPRDFSGLTPWVGLRPCSPDGMPYLGRVPGYENLIVATGHAMLGLSLGPVTGQLVAQLAAGKPALIPLEALAPDRFHRARSGSFIHSRKLSR